MDNDVSAGSASSTSVLGHLALGLTLLAFGIGTTRVIDGVTAAGAVSLALYVGGIGLFVAGLLAFRAGSTFTGTAFAGLGAFWFTWGTGVGNQVSADAAGFFLILWALLTLSLAIGAAGSGPIVQGTYGLFCLALVLLGIAQFAGSDGLTKVGGWVAAVAGLAAWYGATAALANWPTAVPRRAADRRVTAAG
ncbi:acetate uptake transporter [Streptomyces sp. NPDC088725]|uniref:acetate uptake transporter n=1 Tax=Streptomyces sp. NPDC088725 TaxID=3365873 RepID=UPI0038136126